MYIDNNNTVLGSSVLSETHWLQAIYSHNTRIIFDKRRDKEGKHRLLSKYYSH